MREEGGGPSLFDSLARGRSTVNYGHQKTDSGRGVLEIEQEFVQTGWFGNYGALPIGLKEFVVKCWKKC